RGALEVAEDFFERPTELGLDDRADRLPALGRYLVAALLELGDQLLGEEPVTAGDDLTELDVGGAEPLGCDAQAAGDVSPRRGAALTAGTDRPEPDRGTEVAHDAEHAGAAGKAARAGEIGHLAMHDPPHGRHRSTPRNRVGIDDPGWVVAEGSDVEVGRRG